MSEKILKQIWSSSAIIAIISLLIDNNKGLKDIIKNFFWAEIFNYLEKIFITIIIVLLIFWLRILFKKIIIYLSNFETTISTYKIDHEDQENKQKASNKKEEEILSNEWISVSKEINNIIADWKFFIIVSNNLFWDPSIGYKKKLWLYFYVCWTPIHIATPLSENYSINFTKTIFIWFLLNITFLYKLFLYHPCIKKILLPVIKDDKWRRIKLSYNSEWDNWIIN